MKKYLLTALLLFIAAYTFAQSLSDADVIRLAIEANAQGMNQQEIALTLLQKGATQGQLMRLKDMYDKQQGASRPTPTSQESKDSRIREVINPLKAISVVTIDTNMDIEIFGRNMFNNTSLTFEPQVNIATPDHYVLGPGDEVIIDIWGDSEDYISKVISPNGTIMVERVGQIGLSGLTIKEANVRVKNIFGEKSYSGIKTGSVSIELTLGKIRSIKVNIMGEVSVPGTYTLPSLSSVFHGLYSAGGVSRIGSLRSVKVFRKGKELAEIDVYEYIFQGKNDINIILQDGDMILVPPYMNLTTISGRVKRPMVYELKKGESVADLLNYAGNFSSDAYKDNIRLFRKEDKEYKVYNITKEQYPEFVLLDGDELKIEQILPRYENRVEITGAVYRKGIYAIDESVKTLKQLIAKAEGVREDAFLARAILYRQNEDMSKEVLPIDIGALLKGEEDIEIKKNDMLYIPSIVDLQENFVITVKGAIGVPGTYQYVENMSLEDLLVQCGGLLESSSTVKVDVARRIKEPKSITSNQSTAELFSISLKDGLIVDGPADFTLMPFDDVYFRRSPGYEKQRNITVSGEVTFSGEYALSVKGERLSDIIKRVGGLTPEAYVEGACLLRKTTPEEKEMIQEALRQLSYRQSDDTLIDNSIGDVYPVGINLQKALEKPGDDSDLVLKEGDLLIVPEYNGTVGIKGGVTHPNTVIYQSGKRISYYINQSGGFLKKARRCKPYVIYMNGMVSTGRRSKVQPGCVIVVPMKQTSSLGALQSIGVAASAASAAAMLLGVINTINNM